MVAHLLRLKLLLLRNGLRRSGWKLVGLIVGAAYALGAVVPAVAGLIVLSASDVETIRAVLVLGGALLVLGWWVVPLLATGLDATLDPARFVTFAIPRPAFLTGLALSGVLGVPGIATAVVILASVLSWLQHPVAALVAIPCALLSLATCVVGSRATTTAFASLVGRRRYRELAAVAVFVPLMLLGPALTAAMAGIRASWERLPSVASSVGWTPWGASWAVPAAVARGDWVAAGLHALIAVVTLVALVAVWDVTLSRALVTPASGGDRSPARGHGLGAFGWFPATPVGAVAARCLTYWIRDPRYSKAFLIAPILPVVLFFSSRNAGAGGGILLIAGPLVAFILGWVISSDVAYDGTAFWTHLAAPISGRVDRTGRVIAAGAVALAMVLAVAVASVALTGRWSALVPLLGISVGIMLTALGVASVVSARVVYQVPGAGDSPFASPQGATMAAFVSQILGWVVIGAASLPEIVLGAFAVSTGSPTLAAMTVLVGLGLGTTALGVGIRSGGRILDRDAPELFERLVSLR